MEQAQAAAGAGAGAGPSWPPALHTSPSSDTDRGERGDHPQRPEAKSGGSQEQPHVLPSRPGLDCSTRAPGVLRSGSFLDNLADLEARHSAQLTARQVSLFMFRLRQDSLGDHETVPIFAQRTAHQFGSRCLQSALRATVNVSAGADTFPGELAWVKAWGQATANSSHEPYNGARGVRCACLPSAFASVQV